MSTPTPTNNTNWKLPPGIEDHLEDGVYKMLMGVTVGGVVGMVCFRSGQGWRAASLATGVGMAVGSTLSRMYGTHATTASSTGSTSSTSDASSATAAASPVRVQKFQTEAPQGTP